MWPFDKQPPAKQTKRLTREDVKTAREQLKIDREMIRMDEALDTVEKKLAAGRQAEAVYQSILNAYFQQRRHDSP